MSWGRLNDEVNGDDKIVALSDAAHRLWTSGMAYCAQNRTNGFIPEFKVSTFGVRKKPLRTVIDELLACLVEGKGPLWHKVKGGFQMHDYLDWNPSKEELEEKDLAAQLRRELFKNPELRAQVRSRDSNTCRFCGIRVGFTNRRGRSGGTYVFLDPKGRVTLDNVKVSCYGCAQARVRPTNGTGHAAAVPAQVPVTPALEFPPAPDDLPYRYPRRTHGDGVMGGTLQRDIERLHTAPHAWCGNFRKCVPKVLHAEFIGSLGGDRDASAKRLLTFYEDTMRTIPDDQVIAEDAFKFWRPRFAAAFGATVAKAVRPRRAAHGRTGVARGPDKYTRFER